MEKKKLLLISISVGVFLVIIIGTSILVFSPRRTGSAIPIASSHGGPPIPAGTVRNFYEEPILPSLVDPVELVRNPGENQNLQPPPANNTAIQENNIYINGDPLNTERTSGNTATQLVINIPPPINSSDRTAVAPPSRMEPPAAPPPMVFTVPRENAKEPPPAIPFMGGSPPESLRRSGAGLPQAAVSAKPPAPGASTGSSRSIAAGTAAAEAPVRAAESARSGAPPARPPERGASTGNARPAPAAASKTTPSRSPVVRTPAQTAGKKAAPKAGGAAQDKPYDIYWVQVGSFSTQNKAEGAKEVLASKEITSIIENRDVDGKLFYRVRVGPYTSSNEADYWMARIKMINGFEDSQVWKSQARQ